MARKLDLSARQVTALCKGAAKAGFVAEVIIGGVVVRLVPERLSRGVAELWRVEEKQSPESPLEEWLNNRSEQRSRGSNLAALERNERLNQHYDSIGFDPVTMGSKEYAPLYRAAKERWRASIPGTPIKKRERDALRQLSSYPSGELVKWDLVKNCGPDTIERLLARGFIETRPMEKFPDRIGYYVLTEAGRTAAEKLPALADYSTESTRPTISASMTRNDLKVAG